VHLTCVWKLILFTAKKSNADYIRRVYWHSSAFCNVGNMIISKSDQFICTKIVNLVKFLCKRFMKYGVDKLTDGPLRYMEYHWDARTRTFTHARTDEQFKKLMSPSPVLGGGIKYSTKPNKCNAIFSQVQHFRAIINSFDACCSKLLRFEGFSAIPD